MPPCMPPSRPIMAHKFVPRKGFKKDKDQPAPEPSTSETPPPPEVPTEEVPPPEPPPVEDEAEEAAAPPPKPAAKGERRSAKDSILKKLPGKGAPAGPKSVPKF